MRNCSLGLIALSLVFSGCGSNKPETNSGLASGVQQVISEQRLENNYKRQGIRVIYTLLGNLEAIEATGYAAVWGGSENAAREAYRVAELEAKKAMNDFINKEHIRTTTSVMMVSKNLEKAADNKSNAIASTTKRDIVAATIGDDEVEPETSAADRANKAIRNDALNIVSKVSNNIRITSSGILGGMYLVQSEVINNGKTVSVTYRWDKRHDKDRKTIRGLMAQ